VVPKSTLNNWEREVAKWVPGFRTVLLQGAKDERVSDRTFKGLVMDADAEL